MSQESNPYVAPEIAATTVSAIKTEEELQFIRRRFRVEAAGLAGFWFFLGLILVGIGTFGFQHLPSKAPQSWSTFVDAAFSVSCFGMGFVGAIWVIVGLLTAFRVERAIEIGLYTTYGMFVFPAVWMTFIGLLILPLVIAQTHRVLKCAEDLRLAELAYGQAHLADA